MKEKFSTRLTLNNQVFERAKEMVHLGIVITEDMSWDRNITEICKKAYPRVKMLTKLKFVGVRTEELMKLYRLYIRSLTEYCSSAFHSSLSIRLSNKLENIQKVCLRVILNVMYVSYEAALEMCGLEALHVRREHRSLEFALKCVRHETNKNMFPLNPSTDTHLVRNREVFKVNKCLTESYRKSTIPNLQRRLNLHHEEKQKSRVL